MTPTKLKKSKQIMLIVVQHHIMLHPALLSPVGRLWDRLFIKSPKSPTAAVTVMRKNAGRKWRCSTFTPCRTKQPESDSSYNKTIWMCFSPQRPGYTLTTDVKSCHKLHLNTFGSVISPGAPEEEVWQFNIQMNFRAIFFRSVSP